MLARDNLDAVIKSIRPILTKEGFKRHDLIWYRFSGETVQVFELQPSTSKATNRLYINLGVKLRSGNRSSHHRICDCALYGRMDHAVPTDEGFLQLTDFAEMPLNQSERTASIASLVERYALAVLETWRTVAGIKTFLASESRRGFTINRKIFPTDP